MGTDFGGKMKEVKKKYNICVNRVAGVWQISRYDSCRFPGLSMGYFDRNPVEFGMFSNQ